MTVTEPGTEPVTERVTLAAGASDAEIIAAVEAWLRAHLPEDWQAAAEECGLADWSTTTVGGYRRLEATRGPIAVSLSASVYSRSGGTKARLTGLAPWLEIQPPAVRAWARAQGFIGSRGWAYRSSQARAWPHPSGRQPARSQDISRMPRRLGPCCPSTARPPPQP